MPSSAHAELMAIRETCKKLGTFDLSDCEIYATCEPCPMCVAVIIWPGIKKVYYCSTCQDAHIHGFSDQHLRDYFSGKDTCCLDMINVEKRDDCAQLFKYFYELQTEK